MAVDPNDAEIRVFLRSTGATTYTAMAEEIAKKFGPARAWPVDVVSTVYRELCPPQKRSSYERDADLIAFIADRAGLGTLDRIREEAIAKFGADRVPSRSQLFRLSLKAQDKARRAAHQP